MATERVEKGVIERKTFWFRPFCLAVLVLLLLNTIVVGVIVVLLIRQIVTIPPGLLSALTGGPSPTTVQATTVLDRIEALSELITTRYNYSSLVTSNRELPPILGGLYGDKLIMVAVGHVNAGIDMHKASVTENAGTMTITLPPPELQDCFLDEKNSYVVSRETGVFAKPAPNLDVEARRFAVGQFRENAINADIYGEVQRNAQTIVGTFVTNLGVKKFNVVTTPPDPNAPLPDTCK